jgi:polar amino acid transport system substrate-binding protein
LLAAGEVDAVTVNEFLGLSKIHEMGLGGIVRPVRRPLSIEGLHVVISKRHWRGTTFLYRFNAGLADLKASAQYDEIISRHLTLFWDTVN